MGVGQAWLAVDHGDKAALLARLGLVEAGVTSDVFDAPLVCAEFPGRWIVIVDNRRDLGLDQALAAASAERTALGCEFDERVMCSRLLGFRSGRVEWSVEHDPNIDLRHAAVTGEPPAGYEELRARLLAQQDGDDSGDVDYMFDLPVRLGEQMCGYVYDNPRPVVWTILEPASRRATAPRLPQAFRSEILPSLEAAGWTLATTNPGYAGAAWDVVRVVGGRKHLLLFIWREHGRDLSFEVQFQVLEAEDGAGVMLAGAVRRDRAGRSSHGATQGAGFWSRLADRFRASGAAPSEPDAPPPDPLVRLVTEAKQDIATAEAFLATGEANPRIRLHFGSADSLRSE